MPRSLSFISARKTCTARSTISCESALWFLNTILMACNRISKARMLFIKLETARNIFILINGRASSADRIALYRSSFLGTKKEYNTSSGNSASLLSTILLIDLNLVTVHYRSKSSSLARSIRIFGFLLGTISLRQYMSSRRCVAPSRSTGMSFTSSKNLRMSLHLPSTSCLSVRFSCSGYIYTRLVTER